MGSIEMIKLYNMDVMKALKQMPSESVDMQITSPPYWGLRDYGVEGQIGLEPNFNDYIKRMLDIFDEVKRVLKKDGTCWVNLGDTYYNSAGRNDRTHFDKRGIDFKPDEWKRPSRDNYNSIEVKKVCLYCGNEFKGKPKSQFCSTECLNKMGNDFRSQNRQLQDKCLCAIPERFMLGMIDRGWILRNKIIWHKPNHMPTSVKDRFANSWEYLFFFSKSKKYYFDLDAVREPHQTNENRPMGIVRERTFGYNTEYPMIRSLKSGNPNIGQQQFHSENINYNPKGKNPDDVIQTRDTVHYKSRPDPRDNREFKNVNMGEHPLGKNPADFWNITTQPYKEAHFAVFPEALVERPIKTTPRWICNKCGKARERIVETEKIYQAKDVKGKSQSEEFKTMRYKDRYDSQHITKGWTNCNCNAGFHPAVILDIFVGSGTTLKVARDLKRDSIGIEIKKDYCNLIFKRLYNGNQPLIKEFEVIR